MARRGVAAWRGVVLAGLGLLAAAPRGGHAAEARCAVPPALIEDASPLPALAKIAEPGLPIRIVALGSGTTQGIGASGPAASFPARLEVALRQRLASPVNVINVGVQRHSAADMLARLERDVLAQRPALVLWETGTVDAVRGVPLDDFSAALESGIVRLRQAGADVLLIDPQYARYATRMVNILPFIEAMRTVAAADDLILFDRYEVMRYWVENNVFHLDERQAPRLAAGEIDQLYDCIAQLLGQVIVNALPKAAQTAAK
jgi:lysophospholipase L1-like esterase